MPNDPQSNKVIEDVFKRLGVSDYPKDVQDRARGEFQKLTQQELADFHDHLATTPPPDSIPYAENVVNATMLARPNVGARTYHVIDSTVGDDSGIIYITNGMAALASAPRASMGVINARQALNVAGGSGNLHTTGDSHNLATLAAPAASGEYLEKRGGNMTPQGDAAITALNLPADIANPLREHLANEQFSNPIDFAEALLKARNETGAEHDRFDGGKIREKVTKAVEDMASKNPGDLYWSTAALTLKKFPDEQSLDALNTTFLGKYGLHDSAGGSVLGEAEASTKPLVALTKQAQANDATAQLQLGSAMLHGSPDLEIKADPNQGSHWLAEAGKSKDKAIAVSANNTLGAYYAYGQKQPDYGNAVKSYEAAAKDGNVHAMERIGNISLNQHTYGDALKWYQQAAEHGNAEAQFQLSHMYYRGLGTPKADQIRAYEWSVIAAQNGDKRAVADLGGQAYAHLKPQEKTAGQNGAKTFHAKTPDPKVNPELHPKAAPVKPAQPVATTQNGAKGGPAAPVVTPPPANDFKASANSRDFVVHTDLDGKSNVTGLSLTYPDGSSISFKPQFDKNGKIVTDGSAVKTHMGTKLSMNDMASDAISVLGAAAIEKQMGGRVSDHAAYQQSAGQLDGQISQTHKVGSKPSQVTVAAPPPQAAQPAQSVNPNGGGSASPQKTVQNGGAPAAHNGQDSDHKVADGHHAVKHHARAHGNNHADPASSEQKVADAYKKELGGDQASQVGELDQRLFARDRQIYETGISEYNQKYGTAYKAQDPGKPDPGLTQQQWMGKEATWAQGENSFLKANNLPSAPKNGNINGLKSSAPVATPDAPVQKTASNNSNSTSINRKPGPNVSVAMNK